MDVSPRIETFASAISPAEEAFERARKKVGIFLAPLVFACLWFLPIASLSPSAHRLLAILGACVVLWMSEAIPMAVTALLGPSLCVLSGVGGARDVFRPFADPIIFLFIGSFILVEAMMKHGLDRRVALRVLSLRLVGESPLRIYCAYGFITAFTSMWVSNAATTAMMLPIGIAILSEMARRMNTTPGAAPSQHAAGLMLLTSFAASVGGLGTPIGTPPNLIGIGMIEKVLGIRVAFFDWMKIGVPIVLSLTALLILNFHWRCPIPKSAVHNSRQWLESELSRLGPWTRGQVNVLTVFLAAVALWTLPGFLSLAGPAASPLLQWLNLRLPESIVAMLTAAALFALPTQWQNNEFTLTWREAARIDWGTILLFAGGMALGEQMFGTGLARWIGDGLAHWVNARSVVGLTILFTGVAILVSEATSNTASATMVVPIAIAVAQAADIPPLKPALGACFGSSLGFLLPVSTGPNAIVYGSGCVPLLQMIRHGAALDLFGFVIISAAVLLLG